MIEGIKQDRKFKTVMKENKKLTFCKNSQSLVAFTQMFKTKTARAQSVPPFPCLFWSLK